jgi:hypothetical protein
MCTRDDLASGPRQLVPCPQGLGDAQGLGGASIWCEGRVAVENLGDRADSVVGEVIDREQTLPRSLDPASVAKDSRIPEGPFLV